MSLVHVLLIAGHVLFGAAWLGMTTFLPRVARGAATGNAALVEVGQKMVAATTGAAVLFYGLAFANWMVGMQGGLRLQYNAWPYHTAITLGLLLVLAQWFLIRGGWKAVERGGDAKRLSAGVGIGSLLWLAMFVLMYVGRGVVGA